jgi:hypothetical protein
MAQPQAPGHRGKIQDEIVVELSPRPPLAAEKVIDERGVEVRVVGDEKDGPSPGARW